MAKEIWQKMTVHLERLAEAGRTMSGVKSTLERQAKSYGSHYWSDCFASPSFVRKDTPNIENGINSSLQAMEQFEKMMEDALNEAESSARTSLTELQRASTKAKGKSRKLLTTRLQTWNSLNFSDFKAVKETRDSAIKLNESLSRRAETGKTSRAALSNFAEKMTTYVREIIPLRKFRRSAGTHKQYAKLLIEDLSDILRTTSSHGASDPADVNESNYRSLTRSLSEDEKNEIDDWRDSINKFADEVWRFRTELNDKVKEESIAAGARERKEVREEYQNLDEQVEKGPKRKHKVKTLDEAQEEIKKFEELKHRRDSLKDHLKTDKLQQFDDDIDDIKNVGAKTRLLTSKEKFGFVRGGIVATNSYVSDPIGVEHLRKFKIKWKWVAKSYILFENVTLFGWRSSLEDKEGFDPVFLMRRIKRRSPNSEWAKKDYQFWSAHYVKKDGFTYAFILPGMKHSNSPGLSEDRDITIRRWDIAPTEEKSTKKSK